MKYKVGYLNARYVEVFDTCDMIPVYFDDNGRSLFVDDSRGLRYRVSNMAYRVIPKMALDFADSKGIMGNTILRLFSGSGELTYFYDELGQLKLRISTYGIMDTVFEVKAHDIVFKDFNNEEVSFVITANKED